MAARIRDPQSPVGEGVKILLGGAGGTALAVLLLWWGWGRDPLGLFGGDAAPAEGERQAEVAARPAAHPAPEPREESRPAPPPAAVSRPTPGQIASAEAQALRPMGESLSQEPPTHDGNLPSTPVALAPPRSSANPADWPVATEHAPAPRPVAAERAAPKATPPDAEVQEETRAKVRDIFRSGYDKAESREQKAGLAQTLYEQAQQVTDDPDAQFVMLREAFDLALEAERLDLAERSVQAMDSAFTIELHRIRRHMIDRLADAARTRDDRRYLAETALRLAREATSDREYEHAAAMAEAADRLAIKVRDGELRKTVQALQAEVARLQNHERRIQEMIARLEAEPDDPAANLAYGRHLCLEEGEWEKGLPLLVKGSDEALQKAAERDLADPADAAAQIELADQWSAIAESDPALKHAFARAGFWYAAAQSAAEGLDKLKANARLADIAAMKLPIRGASAPRAEAIGASSRPSTPPATAAAGAVQLGATLRGHADVPFAVAFLPDGRLVATAGNDKEIRIWETKPPRLLRTLTGHSSWIWSVAFSPDGRLLASSGGFEMSIRVWRVDTWETVATLSGNSGKMRTVAFLPTAPRVAAASDDGTVRVWDLPSGREALKLSPHDGRNVLCLAVSADGRRLVSGGGDHNLVISDAASGRKLQTLSGHTNGVWAVAVAPDGRRVASATKDRTVRVWDGLTGRELWRYNSPSEDNWCVAFSPDGRWLAAATGNRVQFLDAGTGEPAFAAVGHEDILRWIVFSPDGRSLASVSRDKTLRLWELPP